MNPASAATWRSFEDLVQRILEVNSFQISRNITRGGSGFDLKAQFLGDEWAIEVKYYRTARAQLVLIDTAAVRLADNTVSANISNAILVVSCVLSENVKHALEEKHGITLVDQSDLRYWCTEHPELAEELEALLETDPSEPQALTPKRDKPTISSRRVKYTHRSLDTQGTELCIELKSLAKGKASWAKYEKVCEKILKYLFLNDLHGWHPQKRTDDGLNRYDYVCRVRPATEFWKFIIDHLDSRYVLFEFKNYSAKIKQGQILTTEKYLLERGLRRVAIIMTRVGADNHAIAMTQGAMREHGKLMLILNDEKVCEMLHMKERGEDPTDCLFEIADDFLLRLPR